MASLLRDLPASTPQMIEAFGDEALLAAALRFEAALARAQASAGLIAEADATAIGAACAQPFDIAELAAAARQAGTLAIPLVQRLRERVEAAGGNGAAVHKGVTSQDLADTALMLQAKAGLELLRRDGARLRDGLARLAWDHAATPIAGRTLLQAALPTTFGLKAAQWLLGVDEALARLEREAAGAVMLQLGGAAGTLAGLAGRAAQVAALLGEDLGLPVPALPWHARRGALAGLASALAILTGAAAKVAGDVSLLAQSEVAEAFEPKEDGRGGSSAMAHKRNPTGCQVALSAAIRTPQLAASLMAGLTVQQHERGLGGWQAEAPVLASLFELCHGAVAAMATVAEGLEIHPERMAANLAAAGIGADLGQAPALARAALKPERD